MVVSFIAGFLLRVRAVLSAMRALKGTGSFGMPLIRREVAAGEKSLWFVFDVLSDDDSSQHP